MSVREIIFSEKRKNKIARHLAFWGMYYLHTLTAWLNDLKIDTITNPLLYKAAFYDALYFLPVYLFSVYFSLYFILPRYIAKRNISVLIISVICLLAVTSLSGYYTSIFVYEDSGKQWGQLDVITMTIMKCVPGQFIITGSAIIIKIIKDYVLQQHENRVLEIENARNKLRLLKFQMHPRIMFESLHNIYEDIDAGTWHAPEMILKLSDLLSYLLYESEIKQVPLEKEVTMIENYVALKKLAYKKGLDIYVDISRDMGNRFIPAGLFLPLLEMGIVPAGSVSVGISVRTLESTIYFTLINKTEGIEIMEMPFVQANLKSIKDRLQFSQFNKFEMEYNSTPGNFNVKLQIELQPIQQSEKL